MQYTKVKADTFETLQMNAGIVVDSFDPASGTIGNILGATTGGFTFASKPNYVDFGKDVDNCPPNTWQLKRVTSYDPALSGTLLSVSAALARQLVAAGVVDTNDTTHVIPAHNLTEDDFKDIWLVGDYSDKNAGTTAGFVAVHIMNALNTAGFQWTSSKDAKGQFAFDFHGHYDYDDVDNVPFEIYVKAGTSGTETPSVTLNNHVITVADDATVTLTARVKPSGSTVTWSSANTSVASVAAGVVTGEGTGSTIITASITVNSVTYSDTCTVIVTA